MIFRLGMNAKGFWGMAEWGRGNRFVAFHGHGGGEWVFGCFKMVEGTWKLVCSKTAVKWANLNQMQLYLNHSFEWSWKRKFPNTKKPDLKVS
jgi:hypothetical protein